MTDSFGPWTSRFPQRSPAGRITPDGASPSGHTTRPFGLRFLTDANAVVRAKHDKPPTRQTKVKATRHTTDGKEPREEVDSESYVELD